MRKKMLLLVLTLLLCLPLLGAAAPQPGGPAAFGEYIEKLQGAKQVYEVTITSDAFMPAYGKNSCTFYEVLFYEPEAPMLERQIRYTASDILDDFYPELGLAVNDVELCWQTVPLAKHLAQLEHKVETALRVRGAA